MPGILNESRVQAHNFSYVGEVLEVEHVRPCPACLEPDDGTVLLGNMTGGITIRYFFYAHQGSIYTVFALPSLGTKLQTELQIFEPAHQPGEEASYLATSADDITHPLTNEDLVRARVSWKAPATGNFTVRPPLPLFV